MNYIKIILAAVIIFLIQSCSTRKTEKEATETHEHAERNSVSLTPAQMKAGGIALGSVERKNLSTAIKVNGKLEVPAQNKASITSLYGGVLQSILVHPGSEVRKGQVIATIANTEIAGLQQNLVSINARVRLARQEYERQETLVAGNAAPLKNMQRARAELDEALAVQSALRKQLATLGIGPDAVDAGNISAAITLRAPISGTISDIYTEIGARVDAATPVAAIVNNSELHLDLFVYEKDLPAIRKGQVIHFMLTNNPGKEYDAEIFSIGTAFANDAKAVPVHAEVLDEKTGLIEGMSVTAIVSLDTQTMPSLPTEAIVTHEGKDYIFIRTAGDTHTHDHAHDDHENHDHDEDSLVFERVQVIRGTSDLGYTEIQPIAPLPDNAEVIVRGAFFVMAMMTETGGHSH